VDQAGAIIEWREPLAVKFHAVGFRSPNSIGGCQIGLQGKADEIVRYPFNGRLSPIPNAALAALLALSGCGGMGAHRVPMDQASYVTALSEAQKTQLFTNLVRMRYGEPVSFVTLGQIVQGYTLSGGTSAAANIGLLPDVGPELSGNVEFEDRPTLTFSPVHGGDFRNAFLVPVPPASIIAAIQAGWPPDLVLRLAVQRINGISNALTSGGRQSDADPRFVRIAELMNTLVVDGVVDLATEQPSGAGAPTIVLLAHNPAIHAPDDAKLLAEFFRLLGLPANTRKFKIKFGRTRSSTKGELTIETRSYIQILYAIAATIEVPVSDIENGLTRRTITDNPLGGRPTLLVRSGPSNPGSAHAKTKYDGKWFWIAENDIQSKRSFTLLLLLLTLADRSISQSPPLVTVQG
jgi:hypothetical protein